MELVAWIGLLMLGLNGLHRLGADLPISAITETDFEVALAALLRLLGLTAGYWLLLSTLAYVIVAAAHIPAALEATGWATLPSVRRLADLVAARSLIVALAAPLPMVPLGDLVDPGYVPVPAGDPPTLTTTTTTPIATTTPEPPAVVVPTPSIPSFPLAPAVQAPVVDPEPQGSSLEEVEVVVRTGDHMWGLAEARLTLQLGRPPTNQEIAPYWTRVVEVNRNRIRSGNPDLIFPGEVLVLPTP